MNNPSNFCSALSIILSLPHLWLRGCIIFPPHFKSWPRFCTRIRVLSWDLSICSIAVMGQEGETHYSAALFFSSVYFLFLLLQTVLWPPAIALWWTANFSFCLMFFFLLCLCFHVKREVAIWLDFSLILAHSHALPVRGRECNNCLFFIRWQSNSTSPC